MVSRLALALGVLALLSALPGCGRRAQPGLEGPITLYSSASPQAVQPVLDAYRRKTGQTVRLVSVVSQGAQRELAGLLASERTAPRADVFWSSDIPEAAEVAAEGLAEPYARLAQEDVEPQYRDPQGRWCGFSARTRVVFYNSKRVSGAPPRSLAEMADPRWKGRVALANPTEGDALIQAAALAQASSPKAVADLYRRIRANGAVVVGSEVSAAVSVTSGWTAWTLTSSDVASSFLGDQPVRLAVANLGEGRVLLIPHAAGLVKGSRRPRAARAFLDYLLSREGEELLAGPKLALIPLHRAAEYPATLPPLAPTRVLKVDYAALPRTMGALRKEFVGLFGPAVPRRAAPPAGTPSR